MNQLPQKRLIFSRQTMTDLMHRHEGTPIATMLETLLKHRSCIAIYAGAKYNRVLAMPGRQIEIFNCYPKARLQGVLFRGELLWLYNKKIKRLTTWQYEDAYQDIKRFFFPIRHTIDAKTLDYLREAMNRGWDIERDTVGRCTVINASGYVYGWESTIGIKIKKLRTEVDNEEEESKMISSG